MQSDGQTPLLKSPLSTLLSSCPHSSSLSGCRLTSESVSNGTTSSATAAITQHSQTKTQLGLTQSAADCRLIPLSDLRIYRSFLKHLPDLHFSVHVIRIPLQLSSETASLFKRLSSMILAVKSQGMKYLWDLREPWLQAQDLSRCFCVLKHLQAVRSSSGSHRVQVNLHECIRAY